MKVLASYFGEVTGIYKRGIRIVTLTRENGDQLVADLCRRIGKRYKKGECFRLKVIKNGKSVKAHFKKIKPKTLTQRQVNRIIREVEQAFSRIDLDNL